MSDASFDAEDDALLYGQTFLMTGETGAYKYMSPEVFKHENYGLKADVYSFSVIMYECFEGIIVAEDPVAWAMKAANHAGRPPFAYLYALENRQGWRRRSSYNSTQETRGFERR